MVEKKLKLEDYLSTETTTVAAKVLDAIKQRASRTPKSLSELSPKELKELIDFMSSKYFKEIQEIKDFLYNIVDKETTRRNNAFPYFLDLNNQERYFRLKTDSAVSNYAYNVYFFKVNNIELIEENKTCWFGCSAGFDSYNEPIYELYGLKAYADVSGFVIKNRKTIEEFSTFPDKNYQIENNSLFGYNNNDEFFMTIVKWRSSFEPGKFVYNDSIFKAERISKEEFDIMSKNFKI